MSSDSHAVMLLKKHLVLEFTNTPIDKWGFFFPVLLALWRFIEQSRPGVLSDLNATYEDQPYFEGKGSDWFADLLNQERCITLVEDIFYSIAGRVPPRALERGFANEREVSGLDEEKIAALAALVLAEADAVLRARGA